MRKHGIVAIATMTLWVGAAYGQATQSRAPTAPAAFSGVRQLHIRDAMMAATPPSGRAAEPKIVEVSVPPDSSDAGSLSSNQGVWTEIFPIKDVNKIGIGYIVEPEPFHRSWSPDDFVMHDHMYLSPGVPDPKRANITYRFSKPARIGEVLVIQHANGIGQIEGFVGNNEKSMQSIGLANSTLGANLPLKDGTFQEGYRDLFKFERSLVGKLFRIVITKTPLPNGYAFHRAYPLNVDHRPYDVWRIEEMPKP